MSTASSRRRILVVDDIELNRVLTEAVLRGAAFEVDCVDDGLAALAALDGKRYDLVVMDLDLPGLDGHDAAIAIRDRGHETPRVVALSSRRGADARLRSRAVGMAAHITRPIAARELVREIEQALCAERATSHPDPWERELYEEWVTRLGSDRMEGFLAKLLDQFRSLLTMMIEPEDRAALHRRAHDAASTGGMLGFTEVTRSCRILLEAADLATETAARPPLVEALQRAILRLDRHLSTKGSKAAA